MFSLNRLYANANPSGWKRLYILGQRRQPRVTQTLSAESRELKDAKQYTIPVDAALEAVRNGENPELTTREKHTRRVPL